MTRGQLIEERLTHSVIGAFFEVYNNLGFGFLEHLYVMAPDEPSVMVADVVTTPERALLELVRGRPRTAQTVLAGMLVGVFSPAAHGD